MVMILRLRFRVLNGEHGSLREEKQTSMLTSVLVTFFIATKILHPPGKVNQLNPDPSQLYSDQNHSHHAITFQSLMSI